MVEICYLCNNDYINILQDNYKNKVLFILDPNKNIIKIKIIMFYKNEIYYSIITDHNNDIFSIDFEKFIDNYIILKVIYDYKSDNLFQIIYYFTIFIIILCIFLIFKN